MAAAPRAERSTDTQMQRRLKSRETSPERTKVWIEPSKKINASNRRVPVIYYLSRNGQLDHPHFMEIPLSSPVGLHLRDVINRLNILRGNGMASMYSWSCKRSYRNGYVWHDLCENDFIYPAHGQEYILKGSEILEGEFVMNSDETVTSVRKKDNDHYLNAAAVERRRRHQSWSAFDFREQKLKTVLETPGHVIADATTQTGDNRRLRRTIGEIEEIEEEYEQDEKSKDQIGNSTSSEMWTDEISPPPSDSSPETKSNGRMVLRSKIVNEDHVSDMNHLSGRRRASTVLMKMFSIGFKICGPGSQRKSTCDLETGQDCKGGEDVSVSSLGSCKKYFSESSIDTKERI